MFRPDLRDISGSHPPQGDPLRRGPDPAYRCGRRSPGSDSVVPDRTGTLWPMSDSSPGRPVAPVVLDVWCEMQCPDCRSALDDLRALRARYGDRLEVRLRHFPLEKHRHAFAAAQAVEEAVQQGKGWAYIEAVLNRTGELGGKGEAFLVEVARELGLDAEEFDTALIDGRHILVVDADVAEGKAIGVTGTPTYVVDGERFDGGRSQDGLRERVEEFVDRLIAPQD